MMRRRKRMLEDLERDIRDHIERDTQHNIDRGMSPEEAHYAALRKFGNVTRIKENTREVWSFVWLDQLLQDVRFGLRMLRKSPGFAIVAVVTLALGIGANTAIFSVVNAVFLKPLPYGDPARLMRIYSVNARTGGDHWMNSLADIESLRHQSSDFQGIAYFQEGDAVLTGTGDPDLVRTVTVSVDFFSTLGVSPIEGRAFLPEEHTKGRDGVLVLSDGLRRRLFSGRAAVGQTVTLNGRPCAVIGVMPAEFHFPGTELPVKTDMWLPSTWSIDPANGNRDVAAIARLKRRVAQREVESELAAIHSSLEQEYPYETDWRLRMVPMQEDIRPGVRLAVLIVFGAVSFVLLIACANVANLMLARAASRQREMAVRTALGAGRFRLIRQLLTESALLSLAGGGVGLALAVWGIHGLRSTATAEIPRLAEVQVSKPVLLFTLATSLLVGLVFGLAPALQAAKTPVRGGPGRDALVPTHRRPGSRALSRFLLVSQIAVSLVLLIGAGLMVRSFLLVTSVNLGFQPDNVLTFAVGLSGPNYVSADRRVLFYQQTLDRIDAVPGVESAAVASSLALTGPIGISVRIEGQPAPQAGDDAGSAYQAITADYFRVMRIPLVDGRYIVPSDGKDAPAVIVVNQAFTRKFFPGINPLGHRLQVSMGAGKFREIVGVVGDVREEGLAQNPKPEVYLPLFQAWASSGMSYVVRTRVEPLSVVQPIRREIQLIDKDQPIAVVQTMNHILFDASARPRFFTALMSLFSFLALVLTAVGLYGVMAYLVSERTREIGVRMALGAKQGDVLSMVIWQGLRSVLAGFALGIVGALGLTRLLSSLLYIVRPTDTLTFAIVSVILMGVSLLACYIPARRAMRVDPMVALRYE